MSRHPAQTPTQAPGGPQPPASRNCIVLRSSDKIDFCVSQASLAELSPAFARFLATPDSQRASRETGLQPAPPRKDGLSVVRVPEDSYVLRCLLSALSLGKFAIPVTASQIVEALRAASKYGMRAATDAIRAQVPIASLIDRNDAVATFKAALGSQLADEALAAARFIVSEQGFVAWRTHGRALTAEEQQILEDFCGGYADALAGIVEDIRDLHFAGPVSDDLYFFPRLPAAECVGPWTKIKERGRSRSPTRYVPSWWYSYWDNIMQGLLTGQIALTPEAVVAGFGHALHIHTCPGMCQSSCGKLDHFYQAVQAYAEKGLREVPLV